MTDEWRTLRVVVELPVQGGDLSSKDLSWKVQRILEDRLTGEINRFRGTPVRMGRIRVKQYSRHLAATTPKLTAVK